MNVFQSKYGLITGSSYNEVAPLARKEHNTIKKMTRRQPYVRSTYFNKDKVFINLFWEHLAQKHRGQRTARLKYYSCAIDLIRHTRITPDPIFSYTDMNVILHKFSGKTIEGNAFYVQIKQNKRTGRKDFVSVFPKGHKQ